MKIQIGDAVVHKWRQQEGVGIVIGIARYQIPYRSDGFRVLWARSGVELEHPGDLRVLQTLKDWLDHE